MAIILIISILIVAVIIYMLFSIKISTSLIERNINKLRPPIIRYLNNEANEMESKLKRYDDNDNFIKNRYDRNDIIKNIEEIRKDLDSDNKYQLAKSKFNKKPKSQMGLASNYLKYLECLDYLRKTSNIRYDLLQENESMEIIDLRNAANRKKQYIYNIFDKLLNPAK